jgi:fatty-acyl-CoA synthase
VRERTPERAAVPVSVISIETMPLTGVGKVFKPQVRWDAAERVFTNALEPLATSGIQFEISVGAHETHGTLASVTIVGASESAHEDITRQVHAVLAPFVIHHEVAWR